MPKVSVIPWIIKKIKGAIGIVEDTDTATHAIASGKYVMWKGTLCKASSAIAVNDTLSTGSGGNLTVVDNGGLNDVKGSIPEIVDNLTTNDSTKTLSAAQGYALSGNKQNAGAFFPKVTITGSTQSDFDTALNTQLASMNEQTAIFVILNGSGATVKPTYGSRCFGILYKRNSTYSGCLCVGFNGDQMLANGVCSSGTWTWDVPASNNKKTDYIEINASSYNRNDIAGARGAFALIPNNYFGVAKILFSGSWKGVTIVNKVSSSFGNILYVTDGGSNPYFYSNYNGTETFDTLALNSKIPITTEYEINSTDETQDKSLPSGVAFNTPCIVSGVYTIYNSWVNNDYGDKTYGVDLLYNPTNAKLRLYPRQLGRSTKVKITFFLN